MSKLKRGKTKPRNRFLLWLAVIIILCVVIFPVTFSQISTSQVPTSPEPAEPPAVRAAIVDQLYSTYPNENFTTRVKKTLEAAGFRVDVHRGAQVTVGFYRQLASHDYKVIILRNHAGVLETTPGEISGICLFTNEPYSMFKHTLEQLDDRLMVVQSIKDSSRLFAIKPKFITKSLKGNFNNTVVVVAGCSCLYDDTVASAFTQKGTSAFLAWDGAVGIEYIDKATIDLVNNLLSNRFSLKEAVEATMNTNGPDPNYNTSLKFFPLQNGDKSFEQLFQ